MSGPRQACAVIIGMCSFLAAAYGQFPFVDQNSVSSISGQFIVSSAPTQTLFFQDPALLANTNTVHLDAALLTVAAERFKVSLWQQLGIAANAPWSGKIYLRLHEARSLDETVTITSSAFFDRWIYSVDLPDVLLKTRYARAMTAVLLLEFANRGSNPEVLPPTAVHSAELPDWLVAGLAQQILVADGENVVLSEPAKKTEGIAVNRMNQTRRGFDPFASTRPILQSQPVLTYDQLSWPTDDQLEGADGGVYLASAQLFQFELLGLNDGRKRMCDMLQRLPAHMNWQTAFFLTYSNDFARPLDVEKWWALRVVNFAERTPGPRWTTDVSLARLDELMSVPVDFRADSNAMPSHAEISLQDALKNLDPVQREILVRTKIRDFELEELQLAPPYGSLADGYRATLADFLGEPDSAPPTPVGNRHIVQNVTRRGGLAGTSTQGGARSTTETVVGKNHLVQNTVYRESPADTSVDAGLQAESRSTTEKPFRNRYLVQNSSGGASLEDTLSKLDELDRRRRAAEISTTVDLPDKSGTAAQ